MTTENTREEFTYGTCPELKHADFGFNVADQIECPGCTIEALRAVLAHLRTPKPPHVHEWRVVGYMKVTRQILVRCTGCSRQRHVTDTLPIEIPDDK